MKTKYKDHFLNCMIAAINRRKKTVMDHMHAIASAWKDVEQSIVTNDVWHTLWPATLFDEDEPKVEYFEGFCATNEQGMISKLISYAKSVLDENVKI